VSRVERWRIVLGHEQPLGVLERKTVQERLSFRFGLKRKRTLRGKANRR
jgi:hypothetical protein